MALDNGFTTAPRPPGPASVCLLGRSRRQVEVAAHELVGSAERSACVISGYRGEGKSSLARTLQRHKGFQGVFVVSGPELDEVGIWEAISPQVFEITRRSLKQGEDLMEEGRTLLIIDDFLPRWTEEAIEALQKWRTMSLVVLTTPEYAAKSQETLSAAKIEDCGTVRLHRLASLDKEKALSVATSYLTIHQLSSLTVWVTDNWWWANAVLRYRGLIEPFCAAWKSGLIENVSTETGLLWAMIDGMTGAGDINELPEDGLARWWTALGGLCRRSLETGYPLHASEVEYEARRNFPNESKGASGFHLSPLFGESTGCCGNRWLSLPQPLTEFLAGWNAFHQNLSGTALKTLVKNIAEEDVVVIYVAGHLARAIKNGETPKEKQLTRLFRNLVLHMDRAKDRFGYTLRILSEANLHPELVKFMVAEIDFPKLWEIGDSAVLVRPVEALLEYVQPVKAEVTVANGQSAPELTQVVRVLAQRGIFMFLADMNHLTFGHSVSSNWLIETVQKYGRKGVLQDFMGCLSTPYLNNLGQHVTTQNLVCLRVRVTDLQSVKAACHAPATLPSLMWLEIDFDLPLDQLLEVGVPRINTPMMDLSFRGLTDDDMPRLVAFLATIRTRYSGIHLVESEVTPQGVRTFLKGLYTKTIKTSAHPDAISRYRAWRYRIIGESNWNELSDEEARHLIGHDDRPQYNDNEVVSEGVMGERVEVLTLATFLQVLEDPVCFRYECANFRVVKNVDGTVETKEVGEY
ncbi:uncharacterized protein LOC127004822 isoform X1 [Eriocheir sinensis]|uniref:uncharacterized protein LOC127004822 isoform X1 n=1 Tax=Eriocheir sinensis TaxID=95602 RepID=UPI0021C6F29E|nr:uncharacterized protein LOC127004822 isoform X1 [Eriocheir sinensis]